MSYYISQFDNGADSQQPHNFVLINGEHPVLHSALKYHEQPDYKQQYQWINASEFGLEESFFDSVFTKRQFQNASATTVIINSSTAKLRMEFTQNHLRMDTDNVDPKKQLKTSLLILDPRSESKPVQLFNLKNGSGEFGIHVARQRKFLLSFRIINLLGRLVRSQVKVDTFFSI